MCIHRYISIYIYPKYIAVTLDAIRGTVVPSGGSDGTLLPLFAAADAGLATEEEATPTRDPGDPLQTECSRHKRKKNWGNSVTVMGDFEIQLNLIELNLK